MLFIYQQQYFFAIKLHRAVKRAKWQIWIKLPDLTWWLVLLFSGEYYCSRTLLFCSYQSALSMTDTHSTYRDIPALSDEPTLLLLAPEWARLHPVQVTCLPLISGTGCSSSLCCSVPICFKGLSSCPTAWQPKRLGMYFLGGKEKKER